jgi:PAS domain S-box-containing protein
MSDPVCESSTVGRRADEAVMIWGSGPDMSFTYFSESWLAFTGRTLEEELGDGWAEGVHPDDLARCLDVFRSAFAARRAFQMQYRLRRFDGEYRWILDIGTPQWDSEGRFRGYIGSCVDVTGAQRFGRLPSEKDHGLQVGRGRPAGALTRRERDVVMLLARGLSNRQIAAELVVSVGTVRVHVDHILAKLGLHSRAQVAAWTARQQLRRDRGLV